MPRWSPPRSSWSERSAWRVPRRHPTAVPPPAALRPPTRARTTATTEPVATEAPATEAAAQPRLRPPRPRLPRPPSPRKHRSRRPARPCRPWSPSSTRRPPSTSTRSPATPCSRAASSACRWRRSPTTGTSTTRSPSTSTTPRSCSRCRTTCGSSPPTRRPRSTPTTCSSRRTSEGTPGEPFTVTYKLNPDAHWNNGDPIDVDDYIANWQALNGIDHPDFPVASTDGLRPHHLGRAGRRQVRGRHHVRRRLPGLPGAVRPVVPGRIAAAGDLRRRVDRDQHRLVHRGVHPRLDRHDAGHPHRGPQPELVGRPAAARQDHFRVVSPDAVPTSYANGELDAFDIGSTRTASRSPTPRRAAPSGRRRARTGARSRSTPRPV